MIPKGIMFDTSPRRRINSAGRKSDMKEATAEIDKKASIVGQLWQIEKEKIFFREVSNELANRSFNVLVSECLYVRNDR